MKPLIRSALAIAGAVLLPFCSSNDNGGNPDGGGGGTVNIAGKVVGTSREPVPGVAVVIKSGTTFTVTATADVSGNFTAANVPTPYTATVIVSGTRKGASVYLGMTRADPTLVDWIGATVATPRSATVMGAVTGGLGFPTPSGTTTSALFVSPETAYGSSASASTGNFSLGPIEWYGPAMTTGTIHALQVQRTGNLPTGYSGYGSKANVTLTDTGTFAGQNVALAAVTQTTLSGAYTAPAGYTISQKIAAVRFGTGPGFILVASDSTTTAAFSYITPSITGASMLVAGASQTATGNSVAVLSNVATNASGVALSSPASADLSLPVDVATGVTLATAFNWTAVAGAVHLVFIDPDLSTNPSYAVMTAGTSTTVPDLTAAGISLPAAASYGWQVIGAGPFSGVDSAASGVADLVGLAADGFYTVSSSRTFTTAP